MIWTTRPRFDLSPGISGFAAGVGPTALLIHGVGLRAEAWNGLIPKLSPTFRTVAVDLPGHGHSKDISDETIKAFGDALVPLVEALSDYGGPVRVIGHSLGAMIAIEIARLRPKLIAGTAALNLVYRRSPEAAAAVRARAETLTETRDRKVDVTLQRWFGDDAHDAAHACGHWLNSVPQSGYARAYRAFAMADGPLDADLRKLDSPALFMTGEHDPNSLPDMSRQMSRLAPQGHDAVIAGAAHMAPMTHSDQVAAEILRVLGPSS